MKATIKLMTSEKPTKGGYPIYVKLVHLKFRFKKCIGHSASENWDTDNNQPLRLHPQYIDLHLKVLDFRSKIAKVNLGNYTFNEARNFLFSDSEKPSSSGFLAFFDTRIEEKKLQGMPHTSYGDVKNIIEDYIDTDDIAINDITYEWLHKFMLYKLKKGCKQGGVMSYLRTMRAVYKEAQRRESLNIKHDNPFIGVIKKVPVKKVIQVAASELIKIKKFKPKDGTRKLTALKMQRNLALWFFQFYIGGHDYIDVALLKWTDIHKKRLRFKRFKLRNKSNGGPMIDNMLCDAAIAVIDQYGDKDNARIFSFIPDPVADYENYVHYRRNVNEYLKKISTQLKLKEVIKTKSPRYIFRTYAGENLIHDLIVMKLQGHTPEGITFSYQGVISYKVLDDAHLKIIKME